MSITMAVFDMAGTTVKDKDFVHEALIKAFAGKQLTITRDDANEVMGLPKPVAIEQLLVTRFQKSGSELTQLVEEIHNDFVSSMITFYEKDEDIAETPKASYTFSKLRERGIKVVIDTGFSRPIADAIIKRLGWNDKQLIDFSVTSDEVANGRPYPDMIQKAMQHFQIDNASNVLKVGDTISDLQEGNAAGCSLVVGVTTGAYKKEELEKYPHTHLIECLDELLSIVDHKKAEHV